MPRRAATFFTLPAIFWGEVPWITGALDSKSAGMLLECFTQMNREMQATILMVTHDIFSASYCSRILFLRDGKIFSELSRGNKARRAFFTEILDIVTLLGGDVSNAQ